jgi:hypothetical protein
VDSRECRLEALGLCVELDRGNRAHKGHMMIALRIAWLAMQIDQYATINGIECMKSREPHSPVAGPDTGRGNG